MHLKYAPAILILLLCIVEATAGQVKEQQWIVFDSDTTASVEAALATAERLTPAQVHGSVTSPQLAIEPSRDIRPRLKVYCKKRFTTKYTGAAGTPFIHLLRLRRTKPTTNSMRAHI